MYVQENTNLETLRENKMYSIFSHEIGCRFIYQIQTHNAKGEHTTVSSMHIS